LKINKKIGLINKKANIKQILKATISFVVVELLLRTLIKIRSLLLNTIYNIVSIRIDIAYKKFSKLLLSFTFNVRLLR
jgi:hypothetical protein